MSSRTKRGSPRGRGGSSALLSGQRIDTSVTTEGEQGSFDVSDYQPSTHRSSNPSHSSSLVSPHSNSGSAGYRQGKAFMTDVSLISHGDGDGKEEGVDYHAAALAIQRNWHRWRHVAAFKRIRKLMQATEQQLTQDVLAMWHPAEAALLSDQTLDARIKLRLGGGTFPPIILYKVYTRAKVTYISGHNVFTPGSDAARQACAMQGRKAYRELIEADLRRPDLLDMHSVILPPHRAVGTVPVLDRKGYLRLASTMDSQRASEGGKANGWRPLFGTHALSAATQAMLGLAPEYGSVATGYTPRVQAGDRIPINAKAKRRPLTKGEKAKKLVQRLLASKEREIGSREHTALVNATGSALAEADVEHVVSQAERIQARAPQGYTHPAARQHRGQQHVRVSDTGSSATIKLPQVTTLRDTDNDDDNDDNDDVYDDDNDDDNDDVYDDYSQAHPTPSDITQSPARQSPPRTPRTPRTPEEGEDRGDDEADTLFEWAQELSFAKYNMVWEDF